MTTQAKSGQPARTGAKAGGDAWAYLAVAIILLAAVVLVMQVSPYA